MNLEAAEFLMGQSSVPQKNNYFLNKNDKGSLFFSPIGGCIKNGLSFIEMLENGFAKCNIKCRCCNY
jgi:hypothetical protein